MRHDRVVLNGPDGELIVWAQRIRGDERELLLRARDWARRMYGQQSPVVETVRIERKAAQA